MRGCAHGLGPVSQNTTCYTALASGWFKNSWRTEEIFTPRLVLSERTGARSPRSHEIQRPKTRERLGSATRLKAGSQPIGGRGSVVTTGDGTVEVFLGASSKRSPLRLRSTETTSDWVPREATTPTVASLVTATQPTTPIMAIFLTARRLTRSEMTSVLFVSNSTLPLTGKLGWSARPALPHYG
jgi:hypothetical protein